MKSIHYMAVITTVVALSVYGGIIYRMKATVDRRWLWLAFLVALPLQPLAFYLVRVPLNVWLVKKLGATSMVYEWITLFYAPLTEEPAKLVPIPKPRPIASAYRTKFSRRGASRSIRISRRSLCGNSWDSSTSA